MNRRTVLRRVGAVTATFVAATGTATAEADAEYVPEDCNCDGTYEACCVDGPCDCGVQLAGVE